MEYAICLKWGGLHAHVGVHKGDGEVLYVYQSRGMWSRCFPVVDVQGQEAFRVKLQGLL